MPRSAPGSSTATRAAPARGFTLIEVMVVVALIAIAAGVASLALRDPAATRLEREAERLATLLETARAEARAAGLAVRWVPAPDGAEAGFRFTGLPPSRTMPDHWLDSETRAHIAGDRPLLMLGPEPLIDAQRVQLRLGERVIEVATDGLGPFTVVAPAAGKP